MSPKTQKPITQQRLDEYPPPKHFLRDLCIWVESKEGRHRAGVPFSKGICRPDGSVRAGVMATLFDVVAGSASALAAQPDWIATCDLVLHCFETAYGGELIASAEVLRKGRSTIVTQCRIEQGAKTLSSATVTFSILKAKTELQKINPNPTHIRTEFGMPGDTLELDIRDRLGMRVVSREKGQVELKPTAYHSNTLGAIQGGVVALLAEQAAEEACGAAGLSNPKVSDMVIHYLALGKEGPIRSQATLWRAQENEALVRVEIRDQGAADRLTAVTSVHVSEAGQKT